MISGYLNTFRDSIMSLSHCIDNYVPGILELGRDVRCGRPHRAAPAVRRVGNEGRHLPDRGQQASFARVKKVYEVFGAAPVVQQEVFNDIHSFYGVQGLPFLAKHLG